MERDTARNESQTPAKDSSVQIFWDWNKYHRALRRFSERGRRSSENVNLPPLWFGFDSWIWWYVSVVFFFFFCARPCFLGFSVGSPVLLPCKNQHSHFFFLFYLRSEDDQLGESQYESVNQVEAAKLLGSPNSKNNTRFQPPPENCEYAVVNKANKRVSS